MRNFSHVKSTIAIVAVVLSVMGYNDVSCFRDVLIQSDEIVTVWLGYNSSENHSIIKDINHYSIISDDDPNYKNPQKPVSISLFAYASYLDRENYWTAKMDKKVHCTLPYALKANKHYKVILNDKLFSKPCDLEIDFSLAETPNPSFKLNQVGYGNNRKNKFIYLSSFLGDGIPLDLSGYSNFEIRSESDDSQVYRGEIEYVCENDLQGNDRLYRLDITPFKDTGVFYAHIEGLGRSYPFINGKRAVEKIYDIIATGMYCQRSGTEIRHEYAGKWARPVAHNKMYVTDTNITSPWTEDTLNDCIPSHYIDPAVDSTPWYVKSGAREFRGGHYDAADFDIRISNVGIPERLMSLYEAIPDNFHDGQARIVESNNGIPDILDEAAWGLLAWEYFQDYATDIRGLEGGVAEGIDSYSHPWTDGLGHTDQQPYWMQKVTPYSSFAGAAIFAQAARVFKPFDKQKSDKFLKRAETAYRYAINHYDEKWELLSLMVENTNVEGVKSDAQYDDFKLKCSKAWAAGQLFATTGDLSYLDDFKTVKSSAIRLNDREDKFLYLTLDQWMILWPLISTTQPNMDLVLQNELKNLLFDESDNIIEKIKLNGKNGYFTACSNSKWFGEASPIHSGNIHALIRTFMLTKDTTFLDLIAPSVDFVLGMNPSEMSWMTGAGAVSPLNPANINCTNDTIVEPYPGIVIHGPTQSDYSEVANFMYPKSNNVGFYRRVVDAEAFNHDICEYTVHEQQVGMYVAASLLMYGDKIESVIKDSQQEKQRFKLASANLFMDKLILTFNNNISDLQVELIDYRGRSIINYHLDKHLMVRNSLSIPCNNIASGIYLLRLSTLNSVQTFKVPLI